MFSNTWNKIKAWFKHSETILLERITAFSGFIVMVVGSLDWSPLFSIFGTGTAFSKAELLGLGGAMLAKGIFGEWARRRNTVEVDSKLLPTEIVKEVKTVVTTDLPPTVTKVSTEVVKTS